MIHIDFKVIGFDGTTGDFLNWCLKNRDNLEWMQQMKALELTSTHTTLHFDDRGKIKEIEPYVKFKR